MIQQGGSKNEITFKEQLFIPNEFSGIDVSNLCKYIDDKINSTLQNNSQILNDINLRLNQLETKIEKNCQLSTLNHDDIISITQELVEFKVQINDENIKLNQTIEEKSAQNFEQLNHIYLNDDSERTNEIAILKSEIQSLKDKFQSNNIEKQLFDTVSPYSQINQIKEDELLTNQIHAENQKMKSDLNSIKSEIKKIISRALDAENTEVQDLSFDEESAAILNNSYETTETSESISDYCDTNEETNSSKTNNIKANNDSDIKEKINKLMLENEALRNDFRSLKIEIGKLFENQKQFETIPDKVIQEIIEIKSNYSNISKQIENQNSNSNEINTKISQLILENETLKNNLNTLKSEIDQVSKKQKEKEDNISTNDQYKSIEVAFTANDAQSKAIEANNNSVDAQLKANDAVLRAAEAESKALDANEKADRIVSDNDKMNVDIKCLKYEVKKLRLRVKELETSEIYLDLSDRIDITSEKVHKLKSEIKRIKSEKNNDSIDPEGVITDDRISKITDENASLKKDIKSLKSEIKKIKENQNANESSIITDDFIQKIKDAHTQSTRAYEKASKAHRDISENQNKTNEMNDKVEKLIDENGRLRSDLIALISEVEKIKESRRSDDDTKSNKKKDKKRRNSNIKI